MKCNTAIISLLVLFGAIFVTGLNAQDGATIRSVAGNPYVISAKAGGVNYTRGQVTIQRKDLTAGLLIKGDSVEVGDKVITGATSRTEILLNPGSYARLGGNAEFEFITTNLDDLQLKLSRGSAMFEVYASDDFRITILTPTSRFYLVKSGVYRVDADLNGTSRLEVRKGKAQVGDLNATTLKKSRAADVSGREVAVSKFDRDERDDLENWSRERAKELSEANAQLERSATRNTLLNSYRNTGWDTFGSYGLWAYSPQFGSYCFIPFGNGWSSPYGFGLRRDLYYFRLPQYVYYAPNIYYNQRRQAYENNSITNSNAAASDNKSSRQPQIERDENGKVIPNADGSGGFGPDGPPRRPVDVSEDGEVRQPRRRTFDRIDGERPSRRDQRPPQPSGQPERRQERSSPAPSQPRERSYNPQPRSSEPPQRVDPPVSRQDDAPRVTKNSEPVVDNK